MDMDVKANDWQCAGLFQIAGGRVAAAGHFNFIFYSKTAGGSGMFTFSGVGLGVGGDASGAVLPVDFDKFSSPWASIEGTKPFSGWDLHKAWGRLTTLGGSAGGIGYGLVFITACPPWSWDDTWFASQSVGGYGTGGAGAGGFVLGGGWNYKKAVQLKPKGEYDDMA